MRENSKGELMKFTQRSMIFVVKSDGFTKAQLIKSLRGTTERKADRWRKEENLC